MNCFSKLTINLNLNLNVVSQFESDSLVNTADKIGPKGSTLNP